MYFVMLERDMQFDPDVVMHQARVLTEAMKKDEEDLKKLKAALNSKPFQGTRLTL